jgi:hypothetical protein
MNFHSWFIDKKVMGINVSLDMTVEEYADLSDVIIGQNPLQRRRVGAKGKVYELLRKDILDGCVMPPIVLAVTEDRGGQVEDRVNEVLETGEVTAENKEDLTVFVQDAIRDRRLFILDGLQRTYTIRQSLQDAREAKTADNFLQTKIRAEVYIGLTKMGILYRMLTLNTGQTPMSFRHQIEILYADFIDRNDLPNGVRVTREVDAGRARGIGSYKYQDVVDMLYAFTTGTPKSLDKEALVSELKEIDFLEGYRPGQEDLIALLGIYNRLLLQIETLSGGWRLQQGSEEDEGGGAVEASEMNTVERPFGTSVASLFSKVQPMTGFGAEVKRLISIGKINTISDLVPIVDACSFSDDPGVSLRSLVVILDQIASSAKRIGDAQRLYFQLCFRQMLNDEADAFQNLSSCWLNAQEKYNILY